MAGHSKWANIKHRKAAQDKKRGKLYTTIIREVTVAARLSGGDIDANPRLRAAVDKALGSNMPKDTIERAIKRGVGGGEGSDVEELVYEGYAPGGTAILVEAMTDNRNRTVAEVRHAFGKYGGNLGADGSVAYLFNRCGVASFSQVLDEDLLMEVALEAGAEDIELDGDGGFAITTGWENLGNMVGYLEKRDLAPDHFEITMLADSYNPCDAETAEKVVRLIDELEDLDDVQNVFSNAEFPIDNAES